MLGLVITLVVLNILIFLGVVAMNGTLSEISRKLDSNTATGLSWNKK